MGHKKNAQVQTMGSLFSIWTTLGVMVIILVPLFQAASSNNSSTPEPAELGTSNTTTTTAPLLQAASASTNSSMSETAELGTFNTTTTTAPLLQAASTNSSMSLASAEAPGLANANTTAQVSAQVSSKRGRGSSVFDSVGKNVTAPGGEGGTNSESDEDDEDSDEEKIEIDSFIYREPGCPIVAERTNFDLEQFHGEWKIPFGSMNWLTDMTKAMLKRNPTVAEIKGLCPQVTVRSLANTTSTNVTSGGVQNDSATMEIDWKCSKKKVEFMIRCWPQRNWTRSKFECFFPTINLHSFVMVAATDHVSWILLVRCKIGVEEDVPGEGMSWVLLAKDETVDEGTLSVVFGLLEGYGFDLESFKFQYKYDSCGGNGTLDTMDPQLEGHRLKGP